MPLAYEHVIETDKPDVVTCGECWARWTGDDAFYDYLRHVPAADDFHDVSRACIDNLTAMSARWQNCSGQSLLPSTGMGYVPTLFGCEQRPTAVV